MSHVICPIEHDSSDLYFFQKIDQDLALMSKEGDKRKLSYQLKQLRSKSIMTRVF